jgi:hypothetical protein
MALALAWAWALVLDLALARWLRWAVVFKVLDFRSVVAEGEELMFEAC